VLLIPGFLAGYESLGILASWLKRVGYQPRRASVWTSPARTARLDRLDARLELIYRQSGLPVALIGHSRGGHFAKALAARRPDLVSGIVTLGSPTLDPLALHPAARASVGGLALLGSLGAPGLFTRDCLEGDCCEEFWKLHAGQFPRGTAYVSIYSRSDGIVDWRSCLDPVAIHVEIESSHVGMAVNPDGYRAIADVLRAIARARAPRRRVGSRRAAA
jgi:triacylglycerol lipase